MRQAHEKMECLVDVKEPAVEAAVNDGEREVKVENMRLCVRRHQREKSACLKSTRVQKHAAVLRVTTVCGGTK